MHDNNNFRTHLDVWVWVEVVFCSVRQMCCYASMCVSFVRSHVFWCALKAVFRFTLLNLEFCVDRVNSHWPRLVITPCRHISKHIFHCHLMHFHWFTTAYILYSPHYRLPLCRTDPHETWVVYTDREHNLWQFSSSRAINLSNFNDHMRIINNVGLKGQCHTDLVICFCIPESMAEHWPASHTSWGFQR